MFVGYLACLAFQPSGFLLSIYFGCTPAVLIPSSSLSVQLDMLALVAPPP